jgi:hypothetical protein
MLPSLASSMTLRVSASAYSTSQAELRSKRCFISCLLSSGQSGCHFDQVGTGGRVALLACTAESGVDCDSMKYSRIFATLMLVFSMRCDHHKGCLNVSERGCATPRIRQVRCIFAVFSARASGRALAAGRCDRRPAGIWLDDGGIAGERKSDRRRWTPCVCG